MTTHPDYPSLSASPGEFRNVRLGPHVHVLGSDRLNTVSFDLYSQAAGSKNHLPGHAHLAEHLMFSRGNVYSSAQIWNDFQHIGQQNAGTCQDHVHYTFSSLPETFSDGLERFEDILLGREIDEQAVRKEEGIVRAEMEQYESIEQAIKCRQALTQLIQLQDVLFLPDDIDIEDLRRAHANTLKDFLIMVGCPIDAFAAVCQRMGKSPLIEHDREWEPSLPPEALPGFGISQLKVPAPEKGKTGMIIQAYPWFSSNQQLGHKFIPGILEIMLEQYLDKVICQDAGCAPYIGLNSLSIWKSTRISADHIVVVMEVANKGDPAWFDHCRDTVQRAVQDFLVDGINPRKWDKAHKQSLYQSLSSNPAAFIDPVAYFNLGDWERPLLAHDKRDCLKSIAFSNADRAIEEMREFLQPQNQVDLSKP